MTLAHRESLNVTPRQLEVLAFLARRDHWSVGEVTNALKVSSAAATKAIVRLERKGLVTRAIDLMDRRCVNVSVTRAGADAIRQLSR